MELKDKIKQMREKKKLTKSQLAKMIQVSPAYITKLENGQKKNPSLEIKFKLAKALDMTVMELNILSGSTTLPGMYICPKDDTSSVLDTTLAKFTEDELIKFLINDYNENIFDNKYNTDNITNKQIKELKPIIRGIVEMSLNTHNK